MLATPPPAHWPALLARYVPHYSRLTPAEQAQLLNDARVFIAEKNWEGCRGLVVTETMQVAVAGQAALLTLALGDLYDRVPSVLVYPTEYVAPAQTPLGEGYAIHHDQERLGEMLPGGAVVLSWDVIDEDADHADGANLVLHEFAHALDMRTGATEGTPGHLDADARRAWRPTLAAEYERHARAVEAGRRTWLDPYGAESEEEFFAVVSETFFETPGELREERPRLYPLLAAFYRQDPAGRGQR